MRCTTSLRLSRCWMLIVVWTSMPASSSSITSCQRRSWRLPGALRCASSSTSATCRPARQQRVEIHLLQLCGSRYATRRARQHLQAFQHRRGIDCGRGFPPARPRYRRRAASARARGQASRRSCPHPARAPRNTVSRPPRWRLSSPISASACCCRCAQRCGHRSCRQGGHCRAADVTAAHPAPGSSVIDGDIDPRQWPSTPNCRRSSSNVRITPRPARSTAATASAQRLNRWPWRRAQPRSACCAAAARSGLRIEAPDLPDTFGSRGRPRAAPAPAARCLRADGDQRPI